MSFLTVSLDVRYLASLLKFHVVRLLGFIIRSGKISMDLVQAACLERLLLDADLLRCAVHGGFASSSWIPVSQKTQSEDEAQPHKEGKNTTQPKDTRGKPDSRRCEPCTCMHACMHTYLPTYLPT